MRLPLKGKKHLTPISAYAPTMSYTHEQKLVCQDLSNLLHAAPKGDKLLLLGDVNARVDKDFVSWPEVIGRLGVGQENSNGQLLLMLCADHGLTITNTLFQLPHIHKAPSFQTLAPDRLRGY